MAGKVTVIPLPNLSVGEYLAQERDGEQRHDYIDGRTYAMTGGSAAHNRISLNIASTLLALAQDSGCEVFMADMKARIEEWNAFYYPDVMLCCEEDDREDYFRRAPCLIVEVLSPGTAGVDRREKLAAYQTLPSLQEYMLVDQEKRAAEVYRRDESDWSLAQYEGEASIALACLDVELDFDAIYRGVLD